ncbi:winged helix-turn-helix transcriptional regulator [Tropicibacter sp. R15_0]|nr:metalloregulator ArsR/SmtB family transcription factor [Tropicibacter sp. R15_0]MBO9466119.1 winged helix-turn-helix transcriptional regulator [Tropicibacter sp. R15_0]
MTYGDSPMQRSLSALSDPTRRAVFEAVAAQPRSVTELAKTQPISRPAVSQHLKVLSEANLVRAEAQGTRRIYHLDTAGLAALRDYLDKFWTDALRAYAAEVRRRTKPN